MTDNNQPQYGRGSVQVVSPVKMYWEWSSPNHCFESYDKDTKTNIKTTLPFAFLVLDQLNAIGGFSDEDQSSFWSNEVRDVRTGILTAKTKKGVVASGLYEAIKDKLKAKGAKYAKSVYVGYKDGEGKLCIGNIKLIGSAGSEWIDFCKNNKVMDGAVTVKTFQEKTKGATRYNVPVFTLIPISQESNNAAIELNKELQEYFKAYFTRSNEKASEAVVATEEAPVHTTTHAEAEANRQRDGRGATTSEVYGQHGFYNPPHETMPEDDLPF